MVYEVEGVPHPHHHPTNQALPQAHQPHTYYSPQPVPAGVHMSNKSLQNVHSPVLPALKLEDNSVIIKCPFCLAVGPTKTEEVPGLLTYVMLGLGFIGGCCGFCCLPLCIRRLKDIEHYCSYCNHPLCTYKRL